jgi:glucosamine-6-phosphate deaminase
VNVSRQPDAAAVTRAAADRLVARARAKPGLVIAFPTGRTPIPFYADLQARHARGESSLAAATGFNLDELILPPEDPRTFRSFMALHAWQKIGMLPENCLIPDPLAADLEAESVRYEAAIAASGGLDLAVLGVGADGHVAYNMPGPAGLRTHLVQLPDELAASLDVPARDRPLRAITMGLQTIYDAREILILATGASKLHPVRALLNGVKDVERWPCTFLAGHPALTLLLDPAAAGA